MRKKDGFTLIELLAVIVILAVVLIIAIPLFTKQTDAAKISLYKEQVNRILSAAKSWETENTLKLPDQTEWDFGGTNPDDFDYSTLNINVKKISVKDLQKAGYLKNEKIKNPLDKNDNLEGYIAFYYNAPYKQYVELYCYTDEEYEEYGYHYYSEKKYNNEVDPICNKDFEDDSTNQTQIILQHPIITVTPEGLVASKVATVNFNNQDSEQPINHYIYTTTNTISNKNVYKCEGTEKENLSCDNNPTTNIESGYWYKVIDNIVELTYTDTADVIAYNNLDSTWVEERAQITGFKPEVGLKITEKILTPEEYTATTEFDITYSNTSISSVTCIYGTDSNNLTSNGVITTNSEDATSGKNDYKCEMNNLTPNTTYYYKIVANNDDSTAYTNSFKTLEDKQSPEVTLVSITSMCVQAGTVYEGGHAVGTPTGIVNKVILKLNDEPYSKITVSLINKTSGETFASNSEYLDDSGAGELVISKQYGPCLNCDSTEFNNNFKSFSIVVTDENGNSNRIDNASLDNAINTPCSSSSTTPSTININQPSGPRTSSCSSSSCSCGYTCTVVNQGKSLLVNKKDGSGETAILDAKTGKTITAMNQGGSVSSNEATSVGKNYLRRN